MGWGILAGKLSEDGGKAAVFCNTTTGSAFGPVMDSAKEAAAFAAFLGGDPRVGSPAKLDKQWDRFRKAHPRAEARRPRMTKTASPPVKRRRRPARKRAT